MKSWIREHRTEVLLLFFFCWCSCGTLITARNMRNFGLQQLAVESIVERDQFYLDGSNTITFPGDVFEFHGHHYAIKQPGETMLGSIPYFVLHAFGLSYTSNYGLTAALVTWFSTSLIVALGVVFFFLIVKGLRAALFYAFGTTIFVYAVLPQHDAIAASLLIIAFYLARQNRTLLPSLLLGLTITFSMLAIWCAAVIGIYLISRSNLRQLLFLIIGVAFGLLPLFYYDYVNFGNPLTLPNIAANASDTFLNIRPQYYLYKLALLAKWSLLYTPIAFLGIIGLLKMPRTTRAEQLVCITSIILTLLYLLNIDTMGGWQYGPRYLLPVMPFAMIGIAYIPKSWHSVTKSIATYSIFASLVGVIGGAMTSDRGYITWTYLRRFASGDLPSFPLIWLAIIPIAIAAIAIVKRRSMPALAKAVS